MPSTLDTKAIVKGLHAKALIAEHLRFGIEHGSIRGASVSVARRTIRMLVTKLMNHKKLTDEEREAIREGWNGYL